MRGLEVSVNGVSMVADPSGALYWPDRGLLAVADLHLEKASAFAERGVPLPPYDSAATLRDLRSVIDRLSPARVICLGDSFHDARAAQRLARRDAEALAAMVAERPWLWIAGNHDPTPPSGLGGEVASEIVEGSLRFRHEPGLPPAPGEIAGHLHPKARVRTRGRSITGRCFVSDGARMILPAFGALTGGLDVTADTISELFPKHFEVLFPRPERVHRFPRVALVQTIHKS